MILLHQHREPLKQSMESRSLFSVPHWGPVFSILTVSSEQRLDILVNNAAVASFPEGLPLHEQLRESFATNCIGPVMMVEAFEPLLKKATSTARIVNVSSGVGSITQRLNPASPTHKLKGVHYRASKAALNMINACHAVDYGELGMKAFAVDPGFTVSNLGPHNNKQGGAKPVAEGANIIVRIANGERDDEHAGFLHGTGQYPW